MRKFFMAAAAASMVVPVMPALARDGYRGKVWRDSQGRLRCKRPNGTTGLIVGAAGGALIGRAIDTTRRARHRHYPRRRRGRAARPRDRPQPGSLPLIQLVGRRQSHPPIGRRPPLSATVLTQ